MFLNSLQQFINKTKVLCVLRKNVEKLFNNELIISFNNINNKLKLSYHNKKQTENSDLYVQLCTYIVCFNNENKIFVYKRGSESERRLDDLFSIGIGGHIENNDSNLSKLFQIFNKININEHIKNCGNRELKEELNDNFNYKIVFKSLIHDTSNDVGKAHLGCVGFIKINHLEVSNLNGTFVSYEDLKLMNLESWSQKLLPIIGNINLNDIPLTLKV